MYLGRVRLSFLENDLPRRRRVGDPVYLYATIAATATRPSLSLLSLRHREIITYDGLLKYLAWRHIRNFSPFLSVPGW